jgi:hypothetical protein
MSSLLIYETVEIVNFYDLPIEYMNVNGELIRETHNNFINRNPTNDGMKFLKDEIDSGNLLKYKISFKNIVKCEISELILSGDIT